VTVPAGGSVHINPPAGFIPTDLVILKTVLRGQTRGGFTVYDPPSVIQTTSIQIPCAVDGAQVWGFQYFGATDYGPVFANTPMAMDGFDSSGYPRVVAAQTDDSGQPVLNTSQGHCFVPTGEVILEDPATRKVLPQFEAETTGSICAELSFTSTSNATPVPVEQSGNR
jgi:hypothetical protein